MGNTNEHKSFVITQVKKTITQVSPSIDMNNTKTIRRQHILDVGRFSIVANTPSKFPPDPEENEVVVKDNQFWIYTKINNFFEWKPLGGSGDGELILAENVIEDSDHRFINDEQNLALNQIVLKQLPASSVIEEPDRRFMTQAQSNVVNDVMDGININGGDLDPI